MASARAGGYLPIGDYAAIGDRAGFCLVGVDGAIDWMSVPYLDGEALFSRLIDAERGGYFTLCPAGEYESERAYVPATNVLQTTFRTTSGEVQVTEALTLGTSRLSPGSELVRRVEGLAGEVEMLWVFEPALPDGVRFDLRSHGRWLCASHGALQLALRSWSAGEPVLEGASACACFTLQAGEDAVLAMLAASGAPITLPDRRRCEEHLAETIEEWRPRARGHSYSGPWQASVERSLLAIGLLTDLRNGAIAAAGTTSLPEALGGERNYDYRFAWVRDLSFTLDALIAVGAEESTGAALAWVLRATENTHPRIDPVYTLAGEVLRTQQVIDAAGYRGTGPVHAGNAAGSQLQLGGFGDLLEAVCNYVRAGNLLPPGAAEQLADVVDLLCAIWQRPDSGMWELPERAHYTSSKLGCWTAFKRAVELADAGVLPRRGVARWQRERDAVAAFIEEQLWSERRGAYVMAAGSQALDCAMLLAARRGFLGEDGARLRRTIDAIREELAAGPYLLYRYSGMRERENAFLACSFWLVEALALTGEVAEAIELMNGATALANDVGLFSEEIVPQTGELRGNYPQALTHLALLSAAASLANAGSP